MTDETIEPSLAESRSGPSDEDINQALKATAYKYFGDYPLSESQWDAVHTLCAAACTLMASRLPSAAESTGGVTSPDYVMVPRSNWLADVSYILANNAAEGDDKARALLDEINALAATPPSPQSDELKKRPAAFRVWSNGHWAYFDDEDVARDFAGEGDYQGLYVRDGGQP